MKPNHLTNHHILPDGSIAFTTRPLVSVTCPRCWTDQRSDRNICYCCGGAFLYLDEQPSTRIDLQRLDKETR